MDGAGGVSWELDGGILVLRTGAHFTTGDLIAAFRDGVRASGDATSLMVLFDNRGSAESATTDQIRARVEKLAAAPVRVARVAVLVSDALHYGLARMGAGYADAAGVRVGVFHEPTDAMAWLREDAAGT